MIKYRAGKILSEKECIEYVTISIKKGGYPHIPIYFLCVYTTSETIHKKLIMVVMEFSLLPFCTV